MGFGLRGQDAWRAHPVIANCHKGAFPGLRTAGILVGLYVAGDQLLKFVNSECVFCSLVISFFRFFRFFRAGLILWAALIGEEAKLMNNR